MLQEPCFDIAVATCYYFGMSDLGQGPAPHDLQFQHAEPLPEIAADPNARRCVVCRTPIGATYFHAQGKVVCPTCAAKIQSGQNAPPAVSLGRAALYGAGAALAGCILYAATVILLHLQIGIVAIVIGVMVGKAVRAGSKELGGRPQQILAVVLTYFSITSSYIPIALHAVATNPKIRENAKQAAKNRPAPTPSSAVVTRPPRVTLVAAVIALLLLFAAAPFLGLAHGVGGFITLFIIFIGLRAAWRLTGRSEILIMGPYDTAQ